MSFTITSTNKNDHLFLRSVGIVEDTQDVIKHAEAVYAEITKFDQKKILIDDRETRWPANLFSYYEQVEFFSQHFPPEIRLLKIAIVLPPESEEVGKFWETLCVNIGFNYHAFTSIENAYQWLTK